MGIHKVFSLSCEFFAFYEKTFWFWLVRVRIWPLKSKGSPFTSEPPFLRSEM